MKKGSFTHLTEHDRVRIEVYLNEGKTKYAIAGLLNVDKSTISREINKRGGILRGYTAEYAQDDYRRQKLKGGAQKKIDNPIIASFVIEKIKQGWSPETISGRLKKQIKEKEIPPEYYINHESIYKFIFDSDYGKREKLCNYLKQGKKRRTKKHGRKTKHEIIPNRVFIDNRPEEVNTRLTIGHWEGDAIIYKYKQAIQSIVERKLRYTILTKLNRKTAGETTTAFVNGLAHYYTRSLTVDNGSENKDHEIIADELNIDVYYCHPYHSWEKGTNENTNGLVRRYLPRGTSIIDVSQDDLDDIAWELNNRPRKILGYATPREMLELEYSKLKLSVNVAIDD
jgi:transposase, IS30 family